MLSLFKKQQILFGVGLLLALSPLFIDSLYLAALEVWCAVYGLIY